LYSDTAKEVYVKCCQLRICLFGDETVSSRSNHFLSPCLYRSKQRIHELAKAMGYKGITVKMTKTVDEMMAEGVLEKVMVGTHVKYSVVGA